MDVIVVELECGHSLERLDEVEVFRQIVEFHKMEMQLLDARIIRIRLHSGQSAAEHPENANVLRIQFKVPQPLRFRSFQSFQCRCGAL